MEAHVWNIIKKWLMSFALILQRLPAVQYHEYEYGVLYHEADTHRQFL